MAHRRQMLPRVELEGAELTGALVGIGINLAAAPIPDRNIEDVLLYSSREALEEGDLRLFGLLVQWLETHLARVNVDRLTRLVSSIGSTRMRAFWSAIATSTPSDRRLARLSNSYKGASIDLLDTGTAFQIRRHGEDPRFEGSALRVPGNLLRRRPADVASPPDLARRHRGYYYRVLIGPSYRADMWAAIERTPSLTAAELAREAYGSFATAWAVLHDFETLKDCFRQPMPHGTQVA